MQLDGYKSEFKKRESKSGEGICFYIKEHMNFNVRHDLEKLLNRLRFSRTRFEAEIRKHWFL